MSDIAPRWRRVRVSAQGRECYERDSSVVIFFSSCGCDIGGIGGSGGSEGMSLISTSFGFCDWSETSKSPSIKSLNTAVFDAVAADASDSAAASAADAAAVDAAADAADRAAAAAAVASLAATDSALGWITIGSARATSVSPVWRAISLRARCRLRVKSSIVRRATCELVLVCPTLAEVQDRQTCST